MTCSVPSSRPTVTIRYARALCLPSHHVERAATSPALLDADGIQSLADYFYAVFVTPKWCLIT